MTQSKKFTCQVSQSDTTWTAKVIRRVTAMRSMVTKKQDGFASEAEAIAWGEEQVKALLKQINTNESNRRRAKKAAQGQG